MGISDYRSCLWLFNSGVGPRDGSEMSWVGDNSRDWWSQARCDTVVELKSYNINGCRRWVDKTNLEVNQGFGFESPLLFSLLLALVLSFYSTTVAALFTAGGLELQPTGFSAGWSCSRQNPVRLCRWRLFKVGRQSCPVRFLLCAVHLKLTARRTLLCGPWFTFVGLTLPGASSGSHGIYQASLSYQITPEHQQGFPCLDWLKSANLADPFSSSP